MKERDNGKNADLDALIASLLTRAKSNKYYRGKKEQINRTKKDGAPEGHGSQPSTEPKNKK